jgi:zinc protease
MRPYGIAFMTLLESLWDPEFPYHWLAIGSHRDLEAATLEDVREFFTRWYGPENAVLVVAGAVDPARTRALVERWFGGIRGGPRPAHEMPAPRPLDAPRRVTLQDDVQLPRLYLAWQTPALYRPGDAALDVLGAILSDGKGSRLIRRLVMEEQTAQEVFAGQSSQALASAFLVVATPKPGVPVQRIERAVEEEIARIAREPPAAEELLRAKNKIESSAVFALEPLGGFGGRAARLADYHLRTGDPGYLDEDLARYRAVTAEEVSAAARRWLSAPGVALTVVPREKEGDPGRASGKEAGR